MTTPLRKPTLCPFPVGEGWAGVRGSKLKTAGLTGWELRASAKADKLERKVRTRSINPCRAKVITPLQLGRRQSLYYGIRHSYRASSSCEGYLWAK